MKQERRNKNDLKEIAKAEAIVLIKRKQNNQFYLPLVFKNITRRYDCHNLIVHVNVTADANELNIKC